MSSCTEKKLLLSGEIQRYECELMFVNDSFGVLKYTIDLQYRVDGITLYPGDVTYGLYWVGRPYTLYMWNLNRRNGALYYFNVADRISLTPTEFVWRDLVVDILIDAAQNVHVLDEEELPRTLSPGLRRYIDQAKAHIMSRYKKIILETEKILNAHVLS